MRSATRLDLALVDRGFVSSRENAAELIRQGKVLVNGSVAVKASRQVKVNDQLRITATNPYVSRGGMKLEGALKRFDIEVKGLRVLDVGSSTGGFTDCLLQHGAGRVYAVDVGTNQLHEKIRNDLRVVSFEQTNIRDFKDPDGKGFPLVVTDVSFTSVRIMAKELLDLTLRDGELLILAKPQFEVGRKDASRTRGVIKDPLLWRESLIAVAEEFLLCGAIVKAIGVSVVRGTQGNVEFFFHLSKGSGQTIEYCTALIDNEIARVGADSVGN
ncbi:MAG: TlyA family RNA methyltransferase [Actinomycetota bacterium]|nr:TlyA family RNA methyltransferase [Actinomycetota bacterium]